VRPAAEPPRDLAAYMLRTARLRDHGSAGLRAAVATLDAKLGREYCDLCDYAWTMRRRPEWDAADCRGATVGSIDAMFEAALIAREAVG
jgi:hypothetical protein